MKKYLTLFVVISILMISFGRISNASSNLKMTIDENVIVKNSTKRMYGSNFEWGGEEHIYLKAASGTTETNPEFVKCFEDALPFNRTAGTSANRFYWKKAIGDLSKRQPLTLWGATKINPHGPVEWVRGTSQADPTGEYLIAVNLYDTADNIADYIEFMTGDGNNNPNGGENWAKKRIEYGLADPVNVFAWELGNELDFEIDIDEYIRLAKEKIAVIKSVDPNAKLAAHANTYSTQFKSGWEVWHRTVLKELGDEIDYIAVHYYYPVNDVATGGKSIDTIVKDAKEITGRDDIKIIVSENATARAATNASAGALYRLPHTLHGVMATAEFYVRYLHRPEVVATNYHSINSSSWQICYPEDGTVKSSGILELMKLMINNMCGDVVKSELDGFERNIVTEVVSGAVKTDKGLNIAIVNRNEFEPCAVSFDSEKMYKLKKVSVLTGENKESDNYNGERGIEPDITEVNDESAILSYTVEPLSLTILELEEINMNDEEIEKARINNIVESVSAFNLSYEKTLINGKIVDCGVNVKPFISDGKMFAPVKAVASVFSSDVRWNEDATEATFHHGNNTFVYTSDDANRKLLKKDNCTYVPVRTIAGDFGKDIYWYDSGLALIYNDKSADISKYKDAVYSELNDLYTNER